MRSAGLSSSWRASIPSNLPRCHANRSIAEFRICRHALHRLIRRTYSTQASTQPNKKVTRWIADDAETPSIIWPEPISWSEPMKGPVIARGEMFNTADRIQDQLHADGHLVWGFVVYRCTYSNDTAWQTFLERIHELIRRKMEFYHGFDLLEEECFKLTVFDDPGRFDGAIVQAVREPFKEWRTHPVREEQGTSEEIEERRVEWDIRSHWSTAWCTPHTEAVRYRFCVQIGDAALQSIIFPEGEEVRGEAWVNLIEVDWNLEEVVAEGEQDREQARIDHIDMGGTLEDFDFEKYSEVFPEIDGCTEKNVGWMKLQYKQLIPDFYTFLHNPNTLHEYLYERPPGIGTG